MKRLSPFGIILPLLSTNIGLFSQMPVMFTSFPIVTQINNVISLHNITITGEILIAGVEKSRDLSSCHIILT